MRPDESSIAMGQVGLKAAAGSPENPGCFRRGAWETNDDETVFASAARIAIPQEIPGSADEMFGVFWSAVGQGYDHAAHRRRGSSKSPSTVYAGQYGPTHLGDAECGVSATVADSRRRQRRSMETGERDRQADDWRNLRDSGTIVQEAFVGSGRSESRLPVFAGG